MNRKAVSGIMLILLLVCISTLAFSVQPIKAESAFKTKVCVHPPSIVDPTLAPGSSFAVEVKVSDVDAEIGCYSWRVHMSWNPDVLKFVKVTEGDFLKDQPEGTMGFSRIEQSWALFGWTTIGKCLGVKGNGTLATVKFLVVGIGESIIGIDNPMTCLLGIVKFPPPPPHPSTHLVNTLIEVPCKKENGYFSNFGAVVVSALIDIHPDAVNLKSKGRSIIAYIEFPKSYKVNDINILSVRLNGEVPAELHPAEIGDYDEDDIPDLMVKFNRQDFIATLSAGEAILTITGKVNGTPFEGSDTIRVID